jgi:hypothetical protein
VATESVIEPDRYCRDIEAYLCRKNDGHLIRIVGPAFEQVSGWARDGIPVSVVCTGIDRYFERYYRRGPRRRPVRVEFCEADVRDAFDDWRRAVGVRTASDAGEHAAAASGPRRQTLASHVERVVARLTSLRSSVAPTPSLSSAFEHAARALDAMLGDARRARGHAREQLIDRLQAVDRELLDAAAAALDEAERERLAADARSSVAAFKDRMAADAYRKACAAAMDRNVRAHFDLPTIGYP